RQVAEGGGTAKVTQLTRGGIDMMEVGHRVDEREGDPAADVRMGLHARRNGCAHHLAAPPLHDEEVRPEHRGVVAEHVGARRAIESAPQAGGARSLPPPRPGRRARGASWPMGGRRSTSWWEPRWIR